MKKMNFNEQPSKVDMTHPDIKFAMRALSVIQVHDNLQEKGEEKMSIRKIVEHDEYLMNRKDSVVFYYLVTFGRHAVPMLFKFLKSKTGMEESEIEAVVRKGAAEIERAMARG